MSAVVPFLLPHDELATRDEGYWHEQRCCGCGARIWFPRLRCPICWNPQLAWTAEPSAYGVVTSYAIVHRPHDRATFARDVPITLVAVRREYGADVLAVGGPEGFLWRVGQRVRLRLERPLSHGRLVPVARPEESETEIRVETNKEGER